MILRFFLGLLFLSVNCAFTETLKYVYGVDAVKSAEEASSPRFGLNLTLRVGKKLSLKDEPNLLEVSHGDLFDRLKDETCSEQLVYTTLEYDMPKLTQKELRIVPKEPARARVYVIIDAGVASVSLYMIDYLKKLTDNRVVLIGQPAFADTTYVGVETFELNKDVRLRIPKIVDRGRPRGYNQPYMPDHMLPVEIMQNDALLRKLVLQIIEKDKPRVAEVLTAFSDFDAFRYLQLAAERGDVQAFFNLGLCFHRGYGVRRNGKKALEWYAKAADGGIARAWSNSANIYLYGQDVEKDVSKGLEFLRKAFDANDPYAVWSFGVFYFDGEFFEKNETRGVELLKRAAAFGGSEGESAKTLLADRLKILEDRTQQ